MYKLSVNGGLIDFIGDPKIILMASDPLEFSFGKAHKTYSIQILHTSNNAKLLGDSKIVDAYLYIDTIMITGMLYIDSTEDDTTSAQFVAGNGKIWDALRDVKLTDLDLSTYNHVLNLTNVLASEAGGFYVYDLCHRGANYLNFERIEQDDSAALPSYLYALPNYDVTERYPALNIRTIIDKIFETYTIEDNLPSYFGNLYLMCTKSNIGLNSSNFVSDNTIEEQLSIDETTSNSRGTAGGLSVTNTDIFSHTITESGTFRVHGKVKISLVVSGASIDREIYVTINNGAGTVVYQRTYGIGALNQVIEFDTKFMYVEKTALRLELDVTGSCEFTGAGGGSLNLVIHSDLTAFKIDALQWYGYGQTVEISKIMPDMGVLDFLRMICQYMNIDVYYDDFTRKVYLWQYLPDTIVDWTDKLLLNKAITSSIPEERKYILAFKEDPNDKYSNEQFNIIGDGNYELGEGEEVRIEVPISNTFTGKTRYFKTDLPVMISEGTGFGLLGIYDLLKWSNNFNTRILQLNTGVAIDYEQAYHNEGAELIDCIDTRATGPQFSMYSPEVLTFDDYEGRMGIFNTYHRKTFESVKDGERMECTLVLNESDVLGFVNMTSGKDWRSAFHIMGVNYRLLELEQLEGNIYKGRFLQIF